MLLTEGLELVGMDEMGLLEIGLEFGYLFFEV
jgi:hypothetical protein